MSRAEILARFESHGIQPTPQRIEVAAVLLQKPQHLSAEQVIEALQETSSSVSKATVYNTLNLMAEKGLIRECLVDAERRIYDSTATRHHHFYNVDTGELTDIDEESVEFGLLPALPEGTTLDSAELIIKIRNNG